MQRSFALAGAVTLAALLAACSGGSNTSTETTTSTSTDSTAASPAASASAEVATNGAAASDGAKVFQTNCSSCHGANGTGSPGAFPPLAGNPVVTGDPKNVIHIVKYGLNGKIKVAGKDYNGAMPPWGGTLSDGDIASVVTFIRSSWGNKASAVTAADVTATVK